MTIPVETDVPERGRLSVHVHADMEIKVSAAEAQARVTQFVHSQISSQMHGSTPLLVLKEKPSWQVPVHVTFPSIGDAGTVGTIAVDGESGEMITFPLLIEEMERHAEQIAARFALTTTR